MNNESCRIIGGNWRGRKIRFDSVDGLRPTTDRIRETVFNWLQPYLYNSCCLDLFSGSGALGFEALSRGAREAVFIEQNRMVADRLKDNARLLQAEHASIYHQDAMTWLRSAAKEASLSRYFDLVFLDPPFHADLLAESCRLLDISGCLAEDAIIYVEHGIDSDIVLPENWVEMKQKKAGQVAYRLFENHPVEGC